MPVCALPKRCFSLLRRAIVVPVKATPLHSGLHFADAVSCLAFFANALPCDRNRAVAPPCIALPCRCAVCPWPALPCRCYAILVSKSCTVAELSVTYPRITCAPCRAVSICRWLGLGCFAVAHRRFTILALPMRCHAEPNYAGAIPSQLHLVLPLLHATIPHVTLPQLCKTLFCPALAMSRVPMLCLRASVL